MFYYFKVTEKLRILTNSGSMLVSLYPHSDMSTLASFSNIFMNNEEDDDNGATLILH